MERTGSHEGAAGMLRGALRANAVFSGLCGLDLLFFAGPMSPWLGVSSAGLLRGLGLMLVLFGAHLWVMASRANPRRDEIRYAVLADLAWVVGSAGLLALAPGLLSPAGRMALAAVTVPVALFAILQGVGWRRLESGRAS